VLLVGKRLGRSAMLEVMLEQLEQGMAVSVIL
jgi:hypothetical protein